MGGFVPHPSGAKSLFPDLQKGNMALAVDFFYPHLLRHELSLRVSGTSHIRVEDEIMRDRKPPMIQDELLDWGSFLCAFGDCNDLPDHEILLATFM
eukprot:11423496-Heterocapsa_arctica.AAC.1